MGLFRFEPVQQERILADTSLFLVMSITIPSATSELTNGKRLTNGTTIITVDDEPGDADFTSIKEAVNSSIPGDTIEVYSGTYLEQGIHIVKDNITLLGISHERGVCDDGAKTLLMKKVNINIIFI